MVNSRQLPKAALIARGAVATPAAMVAAVVAVMVAAMIAMGACTRRAAQEASLAVSAERPGKVEAPAAAGGEVWVMRPDGAESCSPKSGQSLEDGAAELKKARVRVLESRKGSDGKMHMQMCGAPSGSTNAYLIPKEDLPQALSQGFVETPKKN